MANLRGLRIKGITFEGAAMKDLVAIEKIFGCNLSDTTTKPKEGFLSLEAAGTISIIQQKEITQETLEKILSLVIS